MTDLQWKEEPSGKIVLNGIQYLNENRNQMPIVSESMLLLMILMI